MMIEAAVKMSSLGRSAKLAYEDMQTMPVGKVGPTPAEPCCKGAGHKCAQSPDAWKDPTWQKLDFSVDEPHRFQYSYESTDGKTAVATAVGDLDCDGKAITYKLELSVGADGMVKTNLIEPKVTDD